MDNKFNLPQEKKYSETRPSKSLNPLQSFFKQPRLILEITGVIFFIIIAASAHDKVSKDNYESLQSQYETLQKDYESLQTKYNEATLEFETTKMTLDTTLSAYEEYQNRMQPFDSLTDDELNIVASHITKTLEEKQAEETALQAAAEAEATAQAQVAQQQVQESTVWIPQSGSKYHSDSSCSNMKNPSQVTLSQAQASGYEPCKKCY